MSINLGPFAVELVFSGGLPSNWTTYTPHCLERDLNNYIATRYNNQSAVDDLVAQPDITSFQAAMDTLSPNSANIGSHTGGHFSLGLALIDFFVSPGDPAFFLHHAMIDRVWATWQAIDPETRLYALNGTTVIFDPPGAPEATLDTIQSWGALGEEKRTGDLMNIDDGDYCYGYE